MTNRLTGTHKDSLDYVDFQNVVFEPLRLNGLSAGSTNMAVNGSVTPQKFWFTSPTGFDLLLHRINITMIDNTAMRADQFANLGGPLTNGLQIVAITAAGDVVREALPDLRIKENGQFALLAGVDVANAAGTRGLFVRWTVSRATGGYPARLPAGLGVGIIVNDDLSSIDTFEASVQGVKVSTA